jgi:hypothetical protein
MNNESNDESSHPYRPKQLKIRDPHHDEQLYRDMAIANTRTLTQMGALPLGGLPMKPKRKPSLPQITPPTSSTADDHPGDDSMKLLTIAAAAMLPLVVGAGCSMANGDPKNPRKNPHPVKRYEVTATVDPLLSWDSVKGAMFFDVINTQCVPQDSFTGGQNVPNTGYEFQMTRMDDGTWRGYVYRDFLQDADYFGKGVCHWDLTGVSTIFTIHGETFNSPTEVTNGKQQGPDIFFKKSDYFNYLINSSGALQFTGKGHDYIQHPETFFQIAVTVKETTP